MSYDEREASYAKTWEHATMWEAIIADLTAQLAAERKRREEAEKTVEYQWFLHGNQVNEVTKAWADRDAALARASAAEAERETAIAEKKGAMDGHDAALALLAAAEADRDRYAEALREIIEYDGGADSALDDPYVMERARAALDEAQAPKAGGGEAG